ncbi:hypothetical protein ODJ79_04545 [Actinoplanes sp. KI2]|uniref:hypothetical protein n=1 Tax=Actinoplanes sp. KI2 TaxID=2983315 RepID=UPI0021D5D475|nr:hypothetical protein [Actinoplanes sp. KI2]MCU7722976.1 hypothetical protein [Actinoplanes sp. KI2]
MRRTVLYSAGLLVAAGASLALAGPASAAPSVAGPCCNAGSAYGGFSSVPYPMQINVSNQIALSNIGVTQLGSGNSLGGGSLYLTNHQTNLGGPYGGS